MTLDEYIDKYRDVIEDEYKLLIYENGEEFNQENPNLLLSRALLNVVMEIRDDLEKK